MPNVGFPLLLAGLFLSTQSLGIALKDPRNPECEISHNYISGDPLAPTFILRSGYSRDNDDVAEGHYETAVFDLELVGRTVGDKTCLYLVNTTTLSSEANNAAGWTNQFFIRKAGSSIEPIQNSAARFSVIQQDQASYLSNQKYIPFEEPRPEGKVALFHYTFLGAVPDGIYVGKIFYQAPTGWRQGQPLFENRDDSKYEVRHVLQWSVSLPSGLVTDASKVRFVTPKWSGGEKTHTVKLMWRDVIQDETRTDLYEALKANPPPDEVLGRCAIKPSRR